MSLSVNAHRLRADLQTLSEIGRDPGGGISRTSFSPADLQAREWYQSACHDAGLNLRVDGIGNMFADAGGDPAAAAVWSGSHLDTVPNGGAFDGAVGAVAALECVRRIAEEGISLRRPVRAVVFADEEGNYSHLLGSSALVRGFAAEQVNAMVGRDGDRLVDAVSAAGWDTDRLTGTRVSASSVYAFAELHIEQGPKLEAAGTQIGVVSSIVGLGGAVIEFHGRADHAGTTPMTTRHDPMRAAADLIAGLPGIAASVSHAAVATCGRVDAHPGGANIVPSLVRVTLDFRDPDAANLAALGDRIGARAAEAARAHGVTSAWLPDEQIAPTGLDARMQAVIQGHAARLHTDWSDVTNGANVLLNTLVELATAGLG